VAQLMGPTGGFLLAYPFVAALAGWIMARGKATFARATLAGIAGELVLFMGGLSWLFVLTHSMETAIRYGLYWFVFAEVIKIMMAAAISVRLHRSFRTQ
jgi:biotin transport system substrate-specific component